MELQLSAGAASALNHLSIVPDPVLTFYTAYNNILTKQGWSDSSGFEGTSCSSRGLRFNFQHPHGILQPFTTQGLRAPMPKSGLKGTMSACSAQTYMQAKHAHT